MKDPHIVLNQIATPDGTILKSMHRHDYVTYVDKNGLEYMVDGGNEYLRRNIHVSKPKLFDKIKSFFGIKWIDPVAYTELSVYSNAPFEVIRTVLHRGGRGKDGTEPLTWVPLDKMSDMWIVACIKYNEERGFSRSYVTSMYRKELKYRKKNKISIAD